MEIKAEEFKKDYMEYIESLSYMSNEDKLHSKNFAEKMANIILDLYYAFRNDHRHVSEKIDKIETKCSAHREKDQEIMFHGDFDSKAEDFTKKYINRKLGLSKWVFSVVGVVIIGLIGLLWSDLSTGFSGLQSAVQENMIKDAEFKGRSEQKFEALEKSVDRLNALIIRVRSTDGDNDGDM